MMSQTDSDNTAAILLEELESIRVLLDAAAMPTNEAADPVSANSPVPTAGDTSKSATGDTPDTRSRRS